jgi:hypothetical protein
MLAFRVYIIYIKISADLFLKMFLYIDHIVEPVADTTTMKVSSEIKKKNSVM